MQLYNTDLVSSLTRCEPCLSKDLVCTVFGHTVSDNLHGAVTLKGCRVVGLQALGDDFDSLIFKTVGMNKVFRSDDAACGAVLLKRVLALTQRSEK
jgi:hypothetical protein